MQQTLLQKSPAKDNIFPYTLIFSLILHLILFLLAILIKVPETQILSFNVKLIESEERLSLDIKQEIKKSVEKARQEIERAQLGKTKDSHDKEKPVSQTNPKIRAEEAFLSQFEKSLISRDSQRNIPLGDKSEKKPWENEFHGGTSLGQKEKTGEKVKVPEGKTGMGFGRWQSGYARKMTYIPPIEYPLYYRQQGIQAEVWLSVEVDPMGRVVEVEILRSSGYSKLDILAKNALKEARFTPLPGRKENDVGEIEVKFQLN